MKVSQWQRTLWIPVIAIFGGIGLSSAWAQEPEVPTAPQAEQGQPSDDAPPAAPQRDAQPGQHEAQHSDQQGQKPELGVRTARSQTRGVVILDVRPGSTAERAGLRPGDYILAIEQQPVESADDLARFIREKELGANVRLDIWRDGQNQQLTAQLQASQQPGRQGDRGQMGQANREEDQAASWIGVWLDQDRDDAQGTPDGQNAEGQPSQPGVVVRHVFPSGPAARAGLRDGDRVLAINEKKIDKPEQLIEQVSAMKPGDSAEFTLSRNNSELKAQIAIGRRGDFLGLRRQQRDDREGNERGVGDFDSGSVPGHAMMLEQHRRFAEQHERIEQSIAELRDEIRQLRADLNKTRTTQQEVRPGEPDQQNK